MSYNCAYDCWDRGGAMSAFAAIATAPGALLGLALLRRWGGKVLRLELIAATLLYGVVAIPYFVFAWELGLCFLAVAVSCALALRLPPESQAPDHSCCGPSLPL